MAVTFDTLRFVDALEKVQIPREQARAIVEMVRDSYDAADVATKGDLRELRTELKADASLLRSEIALARRDTIIWLGAALIVGFGVVIGLLLKLMA